MNIAGPSTQCNYNIRRWNHYVLASESCRSSDEGSESAYSIQGKETDLARDTSDLESDCTDVEYEVASDADSKQDILQFVDSHESSSDDDVIRTTVISAITTEGDLVFADSEDSLTAPSIDSELSPFDYWNCAQCHNSNNNPMFRYCEKCYKVRKDFFPPPPKHHKKKNRKRVKKQKKGSECTNVVVASTSDHMKGTGLHLTPTYDKHNNNMERCSSKHSMSPSCDTSAVTAESGVKRKHDDLVGCVEEREAKKSRKSFLDDSIDLAAKPGIIEDLFDLKDSLDSFSQPTFPIFDDVALVQKAFSEPTLQFSKDDLDLVSEMHSSDSNNGSKSKANSSSGRADKSVGSDIRDRSEMCITCLVEPKSGVFVHGRIAHICCCYKCSVKIWIKTKRCPICKCKVSNVLRAFVS